MDALLGYGSESQSGSESDVSDSWTSEPSLKRQKSSSSPPLSRPRSPALPAPSLLPPAGALLDGTYSPPPAHQQRQLEQAVLHQGRSRAFPHVTGNYPTHALEALLQLLCARLPSLQPAAAAASASHVSDSGGGASSSPAAAPGQPSAPPPRLAQPRYHISLSRTVPLRLHQIEPLVADLRKRLRQQETFCIRMGRAEVFCNDDRSRTFLSLRACGVGGVGDSGCCPVADAAQAADAAQQQQREGGEEAGGEVRGPAEAGAGPQPYSRQLVGLSHAVSRVFAAHALPRFYAEPRPHASVAWVLGDHQQALEAALAVAEVQQAARRLAERPWQLRPAAVVCKAGQREHAVWQAALADAEGGPR
ncbi:hypothetical protein CHLNCDRAFT_136195 [Chlorella variabilis]|uniref:U6 snRNA phosphodiesterase 1 n=1 Tax=Chlorella variabilis TaxID=554065 RepID=E1ZJZ5_CHLVA|nr:hypothetical protein CHLNCDRAFT_136195 [Chlorella variabilis]EFN54078.1 hypothetical protein CHLNCDRAFT_136195 [Chlorella variabilis]|eukprot:XP_005846180.1 hypothetical protein CHLNCDRAFT_136195 [Chlorella variabilis]